MLDPYSFALGLSSGLLLGILLTLAAVILRLRQEGL